MKNLSLLRFAAVFSIFAILLSGCTKDSLKSEMDAKKSNDTSINDPSPTDRNGTIQIRVTDGTPVTMLVFNDNYNSGEVTADDQGIISVGVPSGTYTVVVHVIPDDDAGVLRSQLFENVIVVTGQTTDLGDISFQ